MLISAQTLCSYLSHHWQRIASSLTSLLQVIQRTSFVILPLFFGGLSSGGSLRFPTGVAIGVGSINAHPLEGNNENNFSETNNDKPGVPLFNKTVATVPQHRALVEIWKLERGKSVNSVQQSINKALLMEPQRRIWFLM